MNYFPFFENTVNYLDSKEIIRDLYEIGAVPPKLFDKSNYPLLTHMRVTYGRVNWEDFVVKLDQQTINNLLAIYRDCTCYQKMVENLKPGMKVMLLDGDIMTPVTYNGLITGSSYVEVLTYDDAINTAADWFRDDLIDGFGGFSLTTIYFLCAFRLALMDDDLSDEERFSKERLKETWRHTYAHMMSLVGQKLEAAAIEMAKGRYQVDFELCDAEVKHYEEALS